ncbi:MAG: DUF192 domain-containing protein [Parcubacteria group bacterium]|nr:DUF192 domain-containing protein [Parcubacteria group bacterium]
MSKQTFLLSVFIIVVITSMTLGFIQKRPKYGQVVIGENRLKVELADTVSKRTSGLSNRENLQDNMGMLFVFGKAERHGIWMKDMNFPIDIIWVENNEIIDIVSNVTPEDQKTTYYPRGDSSFVLELASGFVDKNDVKIGDELDIIF